MARVTPSIVHQILGFKGVALSEQAQQNRRHLLEHNGMFSFQLWTPQRIAEELLPQFSQEVREAYLSAPGKHGDLWVRQTDIARVMATCVFLAVFV